MVIGKQSEAKALGVSERRKKITHEEQQFTTPHKNWTKHDMHLYFERGQQLGRERKKKRERRLRRERDKAKRKKKEDVCANTPALVAMWLLPTRYFFLNIALSLSPHRLL